MLVQKVLQSVKIAIQVVEEIESFGACDRALAERLCSSFTQNIQVQIAIYRFKITDVANLNSRRHFRSVLLFKYLYTAFLYILACLARSADSLRCRCVVAEAGRSHSAGFLHQ